MLKHFISHLPKTQKLLPMCQKFPSPKKQLFQHLGAKFDPNVKYYKEVRVIPFKGRTMMSHVSVSFVTCLCTILIPICINHLLFLFVQIDFILSQYCELVLIPSQSSHAFPFSESQGTCPRFAFHFKTQKVFTPHTTQQTSRRIM